MGFFVISLARFVFECDFSLMTVVEKCPWNMTGADFYALSSEALLNAVKRKIALLQAGKNNGSLPLCLQPILPTPILQSRRFSQMPKRVAVCFISVNACCEKFRRLDL